MLILHTEKQIWDSVDVEITPLKIIQKGSTEIV
jgi:hypothetical protein